MSAPSRRLVFLGGVLACAVGVAAVVTFGLPHAKKHDASNLPIRPPPATPPIPRIDVHVHVPPALAEQAVRLFARDGNVVLALNASGGHPGGGGLEESAAATERTRGALRPYCILDYSYVEHAEFPDYVTRALDACVSLGAVGLKISKALGLGYPLSDGSLLPIDDPRLDVVFNGAAERRLPILIHAGDPQAFFRPPTDDNERFAELSAHPRWSFYGPRPGGGGNWPTWQEVFDQFERRVARHPRTTFVGAHFGNAPEEPDTVERMLDRYPNFVVETGARIPEIGRHSAERMRRLFLRHRTRILFGTDIQIDESGLLTLGSAGRNPDPPSRVPAFFAAHSRYFETNDRQFDHPTPIQGGWKIDGIGLPRDVLELLYHRNAERVFRLEPLR